jgi:membrane protease YdiL (CAAX protease family)
LVELKEVSILGLLLEYPPLKALLPVLLMLLLAPPIYWFFRDTWRRLEAERQAPHRAGSRRVALWRFGGALSRGLGTLGTLPKRLGRRSSQQKTPVDYRPAACLAMVAIVLTLHEYYGGRGFYDSTIRPFLDELEEASGEKWPVLARYDQLFGYLWWVTARVVGYLAPIVAWLFLFPGDRVVDMGLRVRGFMSHLWVYALCLGVVFLAMAALATQPEFLNYYPFYKLSSRSWFDFAAWQAMNWVQFFALELFFRGWMLQALRRTFGMGAIFVMVVPYCMIHYGKPYLEAHAAIVAGVVLGSLAMRTRSIYAGFLVHVAVAFSMDLLALLSRDALPTQFWPPAG